MENKLKTITVVTPLMFCAFFVAIASIVYELIIGGISSYLLGNSVYQFSITIGLFMTAMGFGSLLSKYIEEKLMAKFMLIETVLGLVGGIAGVSLLFSYAFTDVYKLMMYGLILMIGTLTGLELPLLTRIIKEYEELKIALANVISVDYIGGLIGSVLFPIFLLPTFGFVTTSYLMGLLNLAVAGIVYLKYRRKFELGNLVGVLLVIIAGGLLIGVIKVGPTEDYLEQKLYRDPVVYSQQSKYQKIVITKDKDDVRLFLDGNIQFSSQDEYRYHEALVHPAVSLATDPKKVLVLGGGDGLVARQLLKYPTIERIDIVDLDPMVTKLAQNIRYLLKVNQNSLASDRVYIHNQDAYQYLKQNADQYNLIISDLPDPNNESLNKLYTVHFYRMVYNHLVKKGIMAVQSSSPYFAPEAFWTIHQTIKAADFKTKPYHCYVPSFGDWGFNLAAKGVKLSPEEITINVPTKFLRDTTVTSLFEFGKDIKQAKSKAEVNTLVRPSLIRKYNSGWQGY